MSAGERYGISVRLAEPECPLCKGYGGWYADHSFAFEWIRCLKCGGSGDASKPKFPVSEAER